MKLNPRTRVRSVSVSVNLPSYLARRSDMRNPPPSLSSSINNRVVRESPLLADSKIPEHRVTVFLLLGAMRAMDIVRPASCQNQASFPRTRSLTIVDCIRFRNDFNEPASNRLAAVLIAPLKIQ